MRQEYRVHIEEFTNWETRIITYTYSMKEVMLDNRGKIMYACDPGFVTNLTSKDTINSLKEEISKFNVAFRKPFIFFDSKTNKWKEKKKNKK